MTSFGAMAMSRRGASVRRPANATRAVARLASAAACCNSSVASQVVDSGGDEERPLALLAAGGDEEGRLRLRLHAVGDDIGSELAGELDAGADGASAVRVAQRAGNQSARDFQSAHGIAGEVAERGVAAAEILMADAYAELAQGVERRWVALGGHA